MRVLIVEDETAAYESLVEILREIDPRIEIAANTESVSQTVSWLKINPLPDLIIMDIHLSDGSAFLIFEYMVVDVPIIFTTAYDQYAIAAFKVNSIDYLLKPIKTSELQRALSKFGKWTKIDIVAYLSKVSQFTSGRNYKDKILIPVKDKLLPVQVKQISYFYTSDKNTSVCLRDGSQFIYFSTLDQIFSSLNPADFYRANKQYIVARHDVKDITIWFDSRLLLTLDTAVPEPIYISKNKAADFKAWIVNG
ncbi:two component transcriptional regulator, LytTR family [Pedobacter westerhofensis]|uniref:Two component transcriptional regulator, LytTR family n=1 Tax=Pedobacter westerhofensis TaxID=425512 RepID=A0A521AU71_9SPHI|nr:LytTR family DNA-binding domain-containing protein [Pedobacter westerhofensis]SMO38335.1 two component transcriptional regulator, LytTR family [Pedobacter westerhofensis]